MNTLNKLASTVSKLEGKKHEASIGDIREILKILVNLEAAALNDHQLDSPVLILASYAEDKLFRASRQKLFREQRKNKAPAKKKAAKKR